MCYKKVLTLKEITERDRLIEELSVLIVQQREISLEIIKIEKFKKLNNETEPIK